MRNNTLTRHSITMSIVFIAIWTILTLMFGNNLINELVIGIVTAAVFGAGYYVMRHQTR